MTRTGGQREGPALTGSISTQKGGTGRNPWGRLGGAEGVGDTREWVVSKSQEKKDCWCLKNGTELSSPAQRALPLSQASSMSSTKGPAGVSEHGGLTPS